MYCKFCGQEVAEESVFCPSCGLRLKEEVEFKKEEFVYSTGPVVWKVFAIIGFIIGIISISLCWVPLSASLIAIDGIICSALGRKTLDLKSNKRAKIGLILSIIAAAISLFIFIIIIANGGSVNDDYYYGDYYYGDYYNYY